MCNSRISMYQILLSIVLIVPGYLTASETERYLAASAQREARMNNLYLEVATRIQAVEDGADKNILDEPLLDTGFEEESPLCFVLKRNDYSMVVRLLNQKDTVDVQCKCAPLEWAGSLEAVNLLVAHKADVTKWRNISPLHAVIRHYEKVPAQDRSIHEIISAMRVLVKQGADVNATKFPNSPHPILATLEGRLTNEEMETVISFLISHGSDPISLTGKNGQSVLEYVDYQGRNSFFDRERYTRFYPFIKAKHELYQKKCALSLQS